MRTGVLVAIRSAGKIEVHPERSGVDAGVFHFPQGHLAGVDVVDGEQALDAGSPGCGWNQRRHPVVAVDQVRLHPRHDVVDDLALKHQCDPHRLIRTRAVNPLAVVENPVFREMDVGVRQHLAEFFQLLLVVVENVAVEHPAVVRHRHVNIGTQLKQCGNQRGGNIRQAPRLGRHPMR